MNITSPVVPAVIPQSLEHVKETLDTIRPFCNEVQIDIVDGVFVPYRSWPYLEEGTIATLGAYTQGFTVEVDLMIVEPERVIREYLAAGATAVVVHLEAVKDIELLWEIKKAYSFNLGLSIENDTPLTQLTDFLSHADYVQLMGIAHIGVQGQPFDERVLTRVSELRAQNPFLTISIDGSVNKASIARLKEAGANRFVSGSAILSAHNPEEAYRELGALIGAE